MCKFYNFTSRELCGKTTKMKKLLWRNIGRIWFRFALLVRTAINIVGLWSFDMANLFWIIRIIIVKNRSYIGMIIFKLFIFIIIYFSFTLLQHRNMAASSNIHQVIIYYLFQQWKTVAKLVVSKSTFYFWWPEVFMFSKIDYDRNQSTIQ